MMPLKITLSKRKRGLKRGKKKKKGRKYGSSHQTTGHVPACPKTTGNGRLIKGSQLTLEFALKLVTMKERILTEKSNPKERNRQQKLQRHVIEVMCP